MVRCIVESKPRNLSATPQYRTSMRVIMQNPKRQPLVHSNECLPIPTATALLLSLLVVCFDITTSSTTVSAFVNLVSTRHHHQHRHHSFIKMHEEVEDEDGWRSLDPDSLVSAPCLIEQTLCHCQSNGLPKQQPQLAGSRDYAVAVLDAWTQEDDTFQWTATTQWKSVTYADSLGTPLYGHLIRKKPSGPVDTDATATAAGILFFHTGAGPHDIFLLWKAVSLLQTFKQQPDDCVVMIVDLLSDETGWAWNTEDRTQYTMTRAVLLQTHNISSSSSDQYSYFHRPVLQDRIMAAIHCLEAHQVTARAAFGWCLGGHAVAELARLQLPTIQAMVTFHGVFHGLVPTPPPALVSLPGDSTTTKPLASSEILVCHGVQDPFVPNRDLENALYVGSCCFVQLFLHCQNYGIPFVVTNPFFLKLSVTTRFACLPRIIQRLFDFSRFRPRSLFFALSLSFASLVQPFNIMDTQPVFFNSTMPDMALPIRHKTSTQTRPHLPTTMSPPTRLGNKPSHCFSEGSEQTRFTVCLKARSTNPFKLRHFRILEMCKSDLEHVHTPLVQLASSIYSPITHSK